jgi:hypothetical protein
LPDPRHKTLGWWDVKKTVPRVEVGARVELGAWKASGDEDDFLSVFPFTRKKDKVLRRTRAYDLWQSARDQGSLDALCICIERDCRGEWDYIGMMNLGWMFLVAGEDVWRRWVWLGAMRNGIGHFTELAGALSTYLKVHATEVCGKIPDWKLFAEAGGMGGYRNPPFPGFDLFAEAAALAHGGAEHYFWQRNFDERARRVLGDVEVPSVEWISFEEWVKSAQWETAGSSDVGRLELDVDGKRVGMKARKNLVLDVVSAEQLYEDARVCKQQKNKVVIKSELGKVRLAVAGDMYTYLVMSWILHLTGGAYLQWKGSTQKESIPVQLKRMQAMLQAVKGRFGLPYDYKGFDHQINTDELVCVFERLVAMARANVPDDAMPAFDTLADNMVSGFHDAVLLARDGDESRLFEVTGGLMSGLRITSVVGDGWNAVVTDAAVELAKLLLGDFVVDLWLKGDDSALAVDEYRQGAVLDVCYDAVGAIGGVGKFSVQYGQYEFLRVWYDEVCSGYPMRALPGLTQRKPWSSVPWEAQGVPRALCEVCGTLERRGLSRARQVKWSLMRVWCQKSRLPMSVLTTPTALGGWGLLPWDGKTKCEPAVPQLRRDVVTVTNRSDRRERMWLERAEELAMPITAADAEALAAEDLSDALRADDVPTVGRAFRDEWNNVKGRIKWRTVPVGSYSQLAPRPLVMPDDIDGLELWRKEVFARASGFGAWKKYAPQVKDIQRLKRYSKVSISEWLKANVPEMWFDVWKLRRRFHMADALAWCLGEVTYAVESAHPMSRRYLDAMVINQVDLMRVKKRELGALASAIAPSLESVWREKQLVREVLCW